MVINNAPTGQRLKGERSAAYHSAAMLHEGHLMCPQLITEKLRLFKERISFKEKITYY